MLKIFFCYARDDRASVEPYYFKIKDMGYDPWMDTQNIFPGQKWEPAIERALLASHVVMVFLSSRSINKRGYLQREMLHALAKVSQSLEEDICLIPLRLEDCEIPDRLRSYQCGDLFNEKGWNKALLALERAAQELNISLTRG